MAVIQEISETEKFSEPPELEQMIDVLEKAGYGGALGWKFLQFLQSPVEKMRNLSEIIRVNFPAFEKAEGAVEKQLEKLIEDFQKGVEKTIWSLKFPEKLQPFLLWYALAQKSSALPQIAPRHISACL